jgi:hypothetical protein
MIYRTKSFEAEAFQFTDENQYARDTWPAWAQEALAKTWNDPNAISPVLGRHGLYVNSPYGVQEVGFGDWIVRDAGGAIRRVEEAAFAQFYEPAGDVEAEVEHLKARAAWPMRGSRYSIDGSIYEGMSAGITDGQRTIAHVWEYDDALLIADALNTRQALDTLANLETTPSTDEGTVERAMLAIRKVVADASEEEQQLPAIQFINNRDDLLARAAIAAIQPQTTGDVGAEARELLAQAHDEAGNHAFAAQIRSGFFNSDIPELRAITRAIRSQSSAAITGELS